MRIAVLRETLGGERRVALVPTTIATLKKAGFEFVVESGAGAGCFLSDSDYQNAGATVVVDRGELLRDADVVVKVQPPTVEEAGSLREGAVLVSTMQPLANLEVVRVLMSKNVTTFSMDLVPRISRAQSMDALSSQATASGYKAVLIAAASLPKFFPMLTTAAGTIFAAKVLVLGAGVAGLQAIATARRLGAMVSAYDVRPAVKEQIESLGAKFLQFDPGERDTEDKGGYAKALSAEAQQRQQKWLEDQIAGFDVVITTALIPGKPAPRLITRETVERMRPGSVIVDLAAEAGGNCEITQAGKTIEHNHVTVHGPVNLPSTMAVHASQMYSRNVSGLITTLVKDGKVQIDLSDDVIRGALVTHQGEVMHEATRAAMAEAPNHK